MICCRRRCLCNVCGMVEITRRPCFHTTLLRPSEAIAKPEATQRQVPGPMRHDLQVRKAVVPMHDHRT